MEESTFETFKELNDEITKRGYSNIKGLKAKITEDDWYHFLEVLPPLKYKGNTFYLIEFLTDDLTHKFFKEGRQYYCSVIDFREEFPNMTDKEYLLECR